MTKAEKIRLAEQAREMVQNPVWEHLTESMVEEIKLEWAECRDPIVSAAHWTQQNAIQDLVGAVKALIANGDIAKTR